LPILGMRDEPSRAILAGNVVMPKYNIARSIEIMAAADIAD